MYGMVVRSGLRRISSVLTSSSQDTSTAFDALVISGSCVVNPSMTTFPNSSAFCAWMMDTSGVSAGSSTTGSPGFHGLSIISNGLPLSKLFLFRMSVPSRLLDGMKGSPRDPARKRDAMPRWL